MPKPKIDKIARREFFRTLKKVKKEDLEDFFRDLMSSAEIKDLSRRFLAAKLLREGKTYLEVREILGMGETTINKVHFKTRGSKILPDLFA